MPKTIARKYKHPRSELTTIWDLRDLKAKVEASGHKWQRYPVYPPVGWEPMRAVFTDPDIRSPHFAFVSNPDGDRVHGGEGIVHELTKLEISLANELTFSFYGVTTRIVFEEIEAEYPIQVGSKKYFVDLIARFSQPADLAKAFNGVIVIEICDTHPIDEDKRNDLRAIDLGTVEISLPKNLHVGNDAELTGAQIEQKRKDVRDFLKAIGSEFCRMKHYPGWKERCAPPRPTWLPVPSMLPTKTAVSPIPVAPTKAQPLPPTEETAPPLKPAVPDVPPRSDVLAVQPKPKLPAKVEPQDRGLFFRFLARLAAIFR